MNKRSIPIVILGCILAVAGLAGYLVPASSTEAEPTARLLMENPGGRIIFSHKAHSTPGGAYGDNSCVACHHELAIAPAAMREADSPQVIPCASCHGAADDPGFVASHQKKYLEEGGEESCVSCHHTRMQGFSDKWNHEDHWNYTGDDCASCHHPEKYEFKPGRFMTIKPQKCANCHTDAPNPMTATTRKDASHKRCASCHDDLFAAGAKACSTCHSKVSLADELANGASDKNYPACATCHGPVPGRMDAFHANCMDCHDKAGKGPGKKAPCAQCHTP